MKFFIEKNKQSFKSFMKSLDNELKEITIDGTVNRCISEEEINARKRLFLNGMANVLRYDLFYDYVVDCIAKGRKRQPKIYPDAILPSTIKENAILKGKCIFVNYNKPASIAAELALLDKDIELESHWCTVYKYLGIGYMNSNGNHSIIANAMNNSNYTVTLEEVDDTELLQTLTTDGAYWFKDNNKVGKVYDFRISLIFAIEQLKNK